MNTNYVLRNEIVYKHKPICALAQVHYQTKRFSCGLLTNNTFHYSRKICINNCANGQGTAGE